MGPDVSDGSGLLPSYDTLNSPLGCAAGLQLRPPRQPRAFSIGFSSYQGTVTAASDWDFPRSACACVRRSRTATKALFYATSQAASLLVGKDLPDDLRAQLAAPRLQRAVSVVYKPETERRSHYSHARLSEQFDALLHIDHTRALEPLAASSEQRPAEAERGSGGDVSERPVKSRANRDAEGCDGLRRGA
ncbi:MAG TPA: erythromycin esterase family protein [Polyangiaceae bacterium]|nr:erythromycin esterase family protein [Polyangiaceae bacterium]